ncbi:MAG: adenylate kinase [Vulcanimicrobiaceae bacterium]
MRVVFLGPPGAGKGTQAKILEERFAARQISTGDLLRKNVAEGTELGRKAKSFMESGGLVPDDLIIAMMEGELATTDAFILDGFPRTVPQAEALDAMLRRLGKPLVAVLLFEADSDVLLRRLTGRWTNPRSGRTYHMEFNPPLEAGIDDEDGGALVQRPDDTAEVVSKRLTTYEAQTAPLIGYYEKAGLLVRIDGLAPIDQVTHEVLSALAGAEGSPVG